MLTRDWRPDGRRGPLVAWREQQTGTTGQQFVPGAIKKTTTASPHSEEARQMSEEAVIVKYRLRVDEHAVEGKNELSVRYKEGSTSWIKLEPFNISVKPVDILLSVESVLVEPKLVRPGSASDVVLVLNNMADSFIKNIKVKLNLDDVPVAPVGSTNEKSLVSIGPKQIANVTFQLTAEPDAASKLYKVPLSIIYKDDLGRNYTKDNVISLAVGDIPSMRFTIDNSEVYKKGKTGTVTIKVANTGIGDTKFLNIRLQESDAYTIISPAEVYVGNIDSDDYETADFKLYALSKDLTLPLTITMIP